MTYTAENLADRPECLAKIVGRQRQWVGQTTKAARHGRLAKQKEQCMTGEGSRLDIDLNVAIFRKEQSGTIDFGTINYLGE